MDLEQLLKDKNYIPSLLRDDHMMDVFHRPDRPAYQKPWNKGNRHPFQNEYLAEFRKDLDSSFEDIIEKLN